MRVSAGLPRAEEKGFGFSSGPAARTHFTAIGTEVRSESELAGVQLEKRRPLFNLGAHFLSLDGHNAGLIRRLVALCLHPMMHRRQLMCLLFDVFGWGREVSAAGAEAGMYHEHRVPSPHGGPLEVACQSWDCRHGRHSEQRRGHALFCVGPTRSHTL